jgi:hypothetical protein
MNKNSAPSRRRNPRSQSGPARNEPRRHQLLSSEFPMHKYAVGQDVFYTSRTVSNRGSSGMYRVVKLLPSDGEDYQYRIKSATEAFERVAKESQLDHG